MMNWGQRHADGYNEHCKNAHSDDKVDNLFSVVWLVM